MRNGALSGLGSRTEAEIFTQQYGVIARAQALELGLTPKVIRGRLSGRWIEVHRGVYRSAEVAVSWRGRLMAACLALGPEAVVSHRAAAALWGLDGFAEGCVEVTMPGTGERRLRGVIVHRTRTLGVADRTERDSLPVTRPARRVIDLAAVVADEDLEAAVDSVLREGMASIAHFGGGSRSWAGRGGRASRVWRCSSPTGLAGGRPRAGGRTVWCGRCGRRDCRSPCSSTS